jgi:PmbA protein
MGFLPVGGDLMSFCLEDAQDILRRAKAAGATSGDIFVLQGDAFEGSVRMGEIEKVRQSLGQSLTLRLFFGHQFAVTSTSDLTKKSLHALLNDTCYLARLSPPDPDAGIPESERLEKEIRDFDLFDPEISVQSIDEKIALAKRAEKSAFDADPRINNSEGASVDHATNTVLYAATNGFSGRYTSGSISLSTVPIASENGAMQRDYWYSTRRKYKELETAESVGKTAAARTVRRLGARSVATQDVPVVFDSETAASLLSTLASAISGYALYKNASFLVDSIGTNIASDCVTIDDDPTIPSALGTKPFDGEGLPSYKKRVVERGVLKSYLLDTYSGRKLNLPSTGNASRGPGGTPTVGTANFHLMPGTNSPQSIIASVQSGLYVTELIGFGVNLVTGDYSQGAAGLWISEGGLAFPVEEVTIAGNLKEMLLQIEQVGNDFDPWKRTSAPTLKISRMTVAGTQRGGS